MQIVYHLGAHCTDDERLVRCLLKNRGVLSQHGVVVPGPARYRNLLRDTAIALKGSPATRDTQALVLEQIMEEDQADRLILSWEHFMSFPPWVLRETLYPSAAERVRAFCNIFPDIQAEFFMAIRNPATFLPALYVKQLADKSRGKTYEAFVAGTDIFGLRWSDTVQSVLDANPGVPLTIWSDEDTPLIWPEVLQTITQHGPDVVLEDTDDLLTQIMSPEGMTRMRAYLQSHPTATPQLRRKVISAFLDKFALPDRIAVNVDLPGWTTDTVARLTETYERDVATLQQMPGVRFLSAT